MAVNNSSQPTGRASNNLCPGSASTHPQKMTSKFVWDKKTVIWELYNVFEVFGLSMSHPVSRDRAQDSSVHSRGPAIEDPPQSRGVNPHFAIPYDPHSPGVSPGYDSLLDIDFVNSHQFHAGGAPENASTWSVSLFKQLNPTCIGVYLHLLEVENESQVNQRSHHDCSFDDYESRGLYMKYHLSVLSQTGSVLHKIENPTIIHLNVGESWGEDRFIPLDLMVNPDSHYIEGNSLRIKVDLWIFQRCINETAGCDCDLCIKARIHSPTITVSASSPYSSRMKFPTSVRTASSSNVCKNERCGMATNSVLESLWRNKEFSDVRILCGNMTLHVHKCVLSAASPVFKTMFHSDMKEAMKNEVTISDMEPSILEALLEYLYLNHLPEEWDWADVDRVFGLVNGCEKYEIKALKDECGRMVIEKITIDNAANVAILVHLFFSQDEIIKGVTYDFITRNLSILKKTKNFVQALRTHPAAFSVLLVSESLQNLLS